MNKFIGNGNLTKDGFRSTESGKEVYSGSIAIRRKFKNQNGEYESDFFNFVYWQPNDYIKANLKKGTKVGIEGRLATRSYDDKGTKRYITEIVVEDIEILSKKEEAKIEDIPEVKSRYEDTIELTEDDIPF